MFGIGTTLASIVQLACDFAPKEQKLQQRKGQLVSGASDMVAQLAKELQPLKAAIQVGVGKDPAGLQIGMAKLIAARMTDMLREATNYVNEAGMGKI